MNPPQPSEQQRADALVLSGLLRASWLSLGTWSMGLSLLALFALAVTPSLSPDVLTRWAPVLLVGLLERYFAFRLTLDERLFHQMGQGMLPNLVALDGALHRLRLRAQASTERPWSERLQGARHLVMCHALLVLLQTAVALLSLSIDRFL